MRKGLAEAKNIDLTIYSPQELPAGHSLLDHPRVYPGQDDREVSRAYIFHKGSHYYALLPTFGKHTPRFIQAGEPLPGRVPMAITAPVAPIVSNPVVSNPVVSKPVVCTPMTTSKMVGSSQVLKKTEMSNLAAMGIGGGLVAGLVALVFSGWKIWEHFAAERKRWTRERMMRVWREEHGFASESESGSDADRKKVRKRRHARDIMWDVDHHPFRLSS